MEEEEEKKKKILSFKKLDFGDSVKRKYMETKNWVSRSQSLWHKVGRRVPRFSKGPYHTYWNFSMLEKGRVRRKYPN
jgi:hypothetical protein